MIVPAHSRLGGYAGNRKIVLSKVKVEVEAARCTDLNSDSFVVDSIGIGKFIQFSVPIGV